VKRGRKRERAGKKTGRRRKREKGRMGDAFSNNVSSLGKQFA